MSMQISVASESVVKNQSAGTRPILWRLVASVDAPHDDVQMMRFVEKHELQPQRNRRLAEQRM